MKPEESVECHQTLPFACPSSFLLRQSLNKLAELVQGELPKLIRNIIGALITIDVHARDIVTQIVHNKVTTLYSTKFEV